jgi:hypothetical protein
MVNPEIMTATFKVEGFEKLHGERTSEEATFIPVNLMTDGKAVWMTNNDMHFDHHYRLTVVGWLQLMGHIQQFQAEAIRAWKTMGAE